MWTKESIIDPTIHKAFVYLIRNIDTNEDITIRQKDMSSAKAIGEHINQAQPPPISGLTLRRPYYNSALL